MAKDRFVDLVPYLKGAQGYIDYCEAIECEVGKYPISVCVNDDDYQTQVRLGLDVKTSRNDAEDSVFCVDEDEDSWPRGVFTVEPHPNCCGMGVLHTFGTYPPEMEDLGTKQRKAYYGLLEDVVALLSEHRYDKGTYKYLWYSLFNPDRRVELIGVHQTRASSVEERVSGTRAVVEDPKKLRQSLFMGWLMQHKIVNSYVFYNSNSGNFCQGMTALLK